MKGSNIVTGKSFKFAISIVEICRIIQRENKEFVLTKQLLRSGTSVGALISESKYAESRADFIHKLSIALKEANESLYWLELLIRTNYLQDESYQLLSAQCCEIIKLLVRTLKSLKHNLD